MNNVCIDDYAFDEAQYIKEKSKIEDISTVEETDGSIEEESLIEEDGSVEQENISYDGDYKGRGLDLVGEYQGLTYYSQADSRWADKMYSSIGNKSQTYKSSGCGATCGAMIVSSSKGVILPTTIGNLAVNNGYRTANNGTAWALFPFLADYFDFREYHETSNFNTAEQYLNNGYLVVAVCGQGLFTTGGHYICLMGETNGNLNIYDPYLYSGKFTTASRKAAGVEVIGNNVYVSVNSFKKYGNAKQFFIFSNDNINLSSAINYEKVMFVATKKDNLNIRSTPGGKIIGSYKKGTKVIVYETSGAWSRTDKGWVSNVYLSSVSVDNNLVKYSIGKYKVNTNLNVRYGAGTNYKKKTSNQLTSNARQQNAKLGGKFNGYRKGVVCTVTNVSGSWGKTSSGWVCLDYCKKI